MNKLKMLIAALLMTVIGSNIAMNKKKNEITCKYISKDGKYVVIGGKEKGFLCPISTKEPVVLEGYKPCKTDAIAISDNGKFVAILQTKELIEINDQKHTKITLWDVKTGESVKEVFMPRIQTDLFDKKGVIFKGSLNGYGTHFNLMLNTSGKDESQSMSIPFSGEEREFLLGTGNDYYVPMNFSNGILQICDYTQRNEPIKILYNSYNSTKDVKMHYYTTAEQTENCAVFDVFSRVQRDGSPKALFLPHDNIVVLKYPEFTDVVTFDPKEGTMEGIILPYAANVVIKNGKAEVVENKGKRRYFLYQEDVFTDFNQKDFIIYNDEATVVDTARSTHGKPVKKYIFKIEKNKNNEETLIFKKELKTQQENLLEYTNNGTLCDIGIGFKKN